MRRLSFLMAFVPFVVGQLPISVLAQSISPDTSSALGIELRDARVFSKKDGSQFQCGTIHNIDNYGPAKKAGLLLGDIVCSIDGHFSTI